YREYVKIVTDNTRIESVIDGVVNTGPEKAADLAKNTANYVTNHSAGEMLGDTLQVGKIVIVYLQRSRCILTKVSKDLYYT
ncbi:hypothetical protein, partial [Proteus mirabilis]